MMNRMRYRRILGALLLIVGALTLSWVDAGAQWIYLTSQPGTCAVPFDASLFEGSWQVVAHAPDLGSATGAVFRLESLAFGTEDSVIVVPAPGVTATGNLIEGMILNFTSRPLFHSALLELSFVDRPPYQPPVWQCLATTRETRLLRGDGSWLDLEDVCTELVDCHGNPGTFLFDRPDSADVIINRTTSVKFRGIGLIEGWGPAAIDITAEDELGWVVSVTPNGMWGYCETCPWSWETFDLQVAVPLGTSDGSTSKVTLWEQGTLKLTEFVLVATEPVPVEDATWGRIKARFSGDRR